jgi:hypothetical protein
VLVEAVVEEADDARDPCPLTAVSRVLRIPAASDWVKPRTSHGTRAQDERITAGRIIFDRLPFALARGEVTLRQE